MSLLVGIRTWLEKYGLLLFAAFIVWQGLDLILNGGVILGDGFVAKAIGVAAVLPGSAYIAMWMQETQRLRRRRDLAAGETDRSAAADAH